VTETPAEARATTQGQDPLPDARAPTRDTVAQPDARDPACAQLGAQAPALFRAGRLSERIPPASPAAHFVSLPQTTTQATPTGYHSSRSRRLPAKQILQAPIRPSSRSCRPFEQGQITGAPIGRRNRRQKHPAGYEADSDSARRNVYDEQFVRHRSSPAVLKIRRRASANFQDRPSCRWRSTIRR